MAVRANPNLKQRALIVAGMTILVIAGVVINQVRQTYNQTVVTARRNIQQYSQVFEANTDMTFQAMELVLDHAVEEVLEKKETASAEGINARFIEIANHWPFIHSTAMAGPDGIIRTAVLRQADGKLHPVEINLDVSNRSLFQVHRQASPADQRLFYISKPAADVVSNDRIVAVTKAIRDDTGKFLGICVVTVTVDTFTRAFSFLVPRYKALELFRTDGVLLASSAGAARSMSDNLGRRLFNEFLPAERSGVHRVFSPDREGDDLLAYRMMQHYPVVIAITASWSQLTGRWKETTLTLVISAVLGILMIGALAWWLVRRIGAEQGVKSALLQSQSSMSESQRLSGIGYFERTLPDGEIKWSSNMYEIHGLKAEVFSPSNDTFINLVAPDDRAHVLATWTACENPSPPTNMECRIVLSDGSLRHMRYSWKILEDGLAGRVRIFGVAQDVSDIRTAEDIIRDDEQRLHDIVECSSDYIWELDVKGAITLFNGATFNSLAGSAEHQVLARGSIDRGGGDIVTLDRNIQNRVKFRGLLLSVRNAEGKSRWVRISGNPRFDGQGRFLGYRGAGTDVTEVLHQQEQDEARRKAEALGRLAGGMAHEINNLLQPIMIYANLGISQSDNAGAVRQYFTRVGLAAERSMMIVRNVLAFARQSPPKRENVDVMHLVRETADLIGGTLEAGTVLAVQESIGDLQVYVDRTGLAQVLTNLLTNAIEALPSGGRVTIRADRADVAHAAAKHLSLSPGVYCLLSVEDNGMGIPDDQLGKVFDPFYTTKPQGKGTGLGLSVAVGLARSWGGTVVGESVAGQKTCFTVYLPIAESLLQAAQ